MNLTLLENKLKRIKISNPLILFVIVLAGFFIRAYYTYWDLNLESSDAFLFLIESTLFAQGNFEQVNIRPLWPLFLSGFFSVIQFDEIINYMNTIRMVSICISSISILLIFKISQKFIKDKYALFVAALFAFDPSLIQNSILGIREPMFILLGMISFYYAIHKNEKFLLLAFFFAGLSFDTRINAIAIPIFLCIFIIIRYKSFKKIIKWIAIGLMIFVFTSFPHILIPLEQEKIPFLAYVIDISETVAERKISPSTYSDEGQTNILSTAIIRELIHFIRISLPFAGIFGIMGLLLWSRERDFKFYAIISSLIVILLIAFPMYFKSAEYRNLLLASPLLFILAGVGLEKKLEKVEFKKTILLVLVIVLFISSIIMINSLDNRNKMEMVEKENIAKNIVNEFTGRFMGDLFSNISHNIPNVIHGGVENTSETLYYNENISITIQSVPIDSVELLIYESERLKVDYLTIDNRIDNRYPIFEEIFNNESEYKFLEKQLEYSSDKIDFHVKIFKINYESYKRDFKN